MNYWDFPRKLRKDTVVGMDGIVRCPIKTTVFGCRHCRNPSESGTGRPKPFDMDRGRSEPSRITIKTFPGDRREPQVLRTSGLVAKAETLPPQSFPRVRMQGAESPINEKPRLNIETAPGECADHCGASPQSLSMHEKFIEGIQGVIFSRCAGRITHMKLSL